MKVYRDFYKNDYKFTFFVEGRSDASEMTQWLWRNKINHIHEWSGLGRNGFSINLREKDSLKLFVLSWGEPLDFMKKP
jgi:hypothetical protein